MSYLTYIKNKFNVNENETIVEQAIKFIGEKYPDRNPDLAEYQIVDNWFQEIFSKWNIECKTLNLSQSHFLGKLEPKLNGFILNLNKNLFSTQKRFVIAHELAHIISFDTEKNWPTSNLIHSKIEEYYCDKIARSLLLPDSLINLRSIDIVNLNSTQIEELKSLQSKFEISLWQIVNKILEDTSNDSLIGVCWKYKFQPENDSHLKVIDYYVPPGHFIPRNDRIFVERPKKKRKVTQLSKLSLESFEDFKRNTRDEINLSPQIAFKLKETYTGYDLISIGSLYKKNLFSTAIYNETTAGEYIIQIIKLK